MRKIFFIVLAILITTLVLFLLSPKSPPQPAAAPLPQPSIPSSFPLNALPSPQTKSLTTDSIPQTITTALQEPLIITTLTATNLAATLNLIPLPQLKDYFVATNNKTTLTINLTTGQTSLVQPLSPSLTSLNQTDLTPMLNSLLAQLGPLGSLPNPVYEFAFFTATSPETAVVSPPSLATTALVEIFPTLNSYKIVSPNHRPIGQAGFATATFSLTNNTIDFTFSPLRLTLTPATYSLKPLDDISPTPISIFPHGQHYKNIEAGADLLPTQISYSKIELVYYADGVPNQPLVPMFLLTGTATLKTGQPATITALSPATQ